MKTTKTEPSFHSVFFILLYFISVYFDDVAVFTFRSNRASTARILHQSIYVHYHTTYALTKL
jgi:hypothetical protein